MADAVIVGSGPNGLAAAVTLARAGLDVSVYEAQPTVGGGAHTADLGLAPDLVHDICSAVHPTALASPFFRQFKLADRVPFAVPELSYGHILDEQTIGLSYHSLERTADFLGPDGPRWKRLMKPLIRESYSAAAYFAVRSLILPSFEQPIAPAMIAGVGAHAIAPYPSMVGRGAALMLGSLAHSVGWPIPVGGSQKIVDALVDDLLANGGRIERNHEITELPRADVVMLDVTPRAFAAMSGDRLPMRYSRALADFKYGAAAAKLDLAVSEPIPWTRPELRHAGTVHIGGTVAQIHESGVAVAHGRYATDPVVLVSQPALVDPTRANAAGAQPIWAYMHVPHNAPLDPTEAIIERIERFAPGFRDTIIASQAISAEKMSDHNANYIGGDIAAGAISIRQMAARPTARWPWTTPIKGVYLCSSSTPPGPGVHGMSGFLAARLALKQQFGMKVPDLGVR